MIVARDCAGLLGIVLPKAFVLFIFGIIMTGAPAWAQKKALPANRAAASANASQTQKNKAFALDVVKSAVALPQSDLQDRLRVLNSAATLASSLDPRYAQSLVREGVKVESQVIAGGERPQVSIMSSGQVDCATAQNFVTSLPVSAVALAEQSLIAGLSACPKQLADATARQLDGAMAQGILAPRAELAAMRTQGAKSAWTQSAFEKFFSSLPADAEGSRANAPNFAQLYFQMGASVDRAVAQSSGVKLLSWLAKLDDSGERQIALHVTTDAMQRILGKEAYEEALRSDAAVQSFVANAGQGQYGQIMQPEQGSVSVLNALSHVNEDHSSELNGLPATQRAREAAANGFAAGSNGNRKLAERYFDIAFAALDEMWPDRGAAPGAEAVVEEVTQAAAQIDRVDALARAERLQQPPEQALGMLAVARTVATGGA